MLLRDGSPWGPPPLPELLVGQLAAHGFAPTEAAECARQIDGRPGGAAEASLFVDLGSCKLIDGDIDGAVAAWRHALASAEQTACARALLNLGLLYEHLHLHARAVLVLRSAGDLKIEPYASLAVMAVARCQRALGQSEQAIETMARLAEVTMAERPDATALAETLLGLGDLAEQAGQLDRAERAWRAVAGAADTPSRRVALDRLADLLRRLGHSDEVIELLDGQPELHDRDNVGWALDRADTLGRLGQVEQARILTASISGEQVATPDRFRLAETRLQLGLVNEAIDELEALLGRPELETSQRAGFLLGEVYRSYEMNDAAILMYLRVVDADDSYWTPKAALALGDLFVASDQLVEARQHWKLAADSSIAAVREAARARISTTAPAGEAPQAKQAGATGATRQTRTVADIGAVGIDPVVVERAPVAAESVVVERASVAAESVGVERAPVAAESVVVERAPVAAESVGVEPAPVAAESVGVAAVSVAAESVGVEPAPVAAEPAGAEAAPAEPVVVLLSSLDDDVADGDAGPVNNGYQETVDSDRPARRSRAGFSAMIAEQNPYAALAPDDHDGGVPPSTRNPYAELAPNFDTTSPTPPPEVEPGDWESMLEDWPKPIPDEKPRPKRRSRAFSRYT